MNLDLIRLAFETPRYLSKHSAWVEHIPFAFAVVDLLRPTTLVELGAHMGDSYCAFCQAVDTLALATRCTAIDTWQGDRHAGYTDGDIILADLRRYHDPLYGRFSRLLQATFDQAAPQFPDGSIDLLHIDGLHTYEAVRHDFETWLPKVSERGVVLFHDTRERFADFGVYRLWAELAPRYRSFEFHHGHGLGVLAVGAAVPPRMLEWLECAQRDPESARATFAALGAHWETRKLLKIAESRILRDAALTLYWPNAAGRFDAQNMQTVSMLPDGELRRAILRAEVTGPTTLRLDPGETPGFWRIEQFAIAAAPRNSGTAVPAVKVQGALRASPGVMLIPTQEDGRPGCILFCMVNDPQLGLDVALPHAPPGGGYVLELLVDCRVWDSFGALSSAGGAGLPVAQALRSILERGQ